MFLTLKVPETKIAEFANSVDFDEVAHNEPPHLNLQYLLCSLWILNMIWFGLNNFWKFADENIVVCFLVTQVSTQRRCNYKIYAHDVNASH